MDTLFGHLATRFGSHPENLATEGLHYVLCRSADARRLFLRFLGQAGGSFGGDLAFETQAAEDGAIPDLVGKDATGVKVAIVEAKFWAGLTERQPNAYLDQLPTSSGLLLFVAPGRRFETLWPELLTRCQKVGRQVEGHECGSEWRVARLADGRRLALTSWRAVLEALHTGLQQAGELAAAADVMQFRGLADRMDTDAFLPLTSEELTSNLGTRIVQFCGLVDGAADRLEAEKLADSRGLRRTGGRHGSWSRFFRLHHTGCRLYFNPLGWSRHGQPIWLEVKGSNGQPSPAVNEALRPLGQETPPRPIVAQWGAYVPINLPTGVERDAVLEAMLVTIRCVAELVKDVSPVGPPRRHRGGEAAPGSGSGPTAGPGLEALAAEVSRPARANGSS